jgi:hypothetical protein
MRNPAKLAFSAKYSEYGIWGALGLSDQDFCDELSIVSAVGRDLCREIVEGNEGALILDLDER